MTLAPATRHPYRWVVFGGIYAVYTAFGLVATSIPPLVGEVRADLGLGVGAMGLALGAWQLVYIVTAPIGGRLVDRLGLHRAVGLGSIVVIASAGLRAMAVDLPTLCGAIALFGVGGPLISAGAPTAVGLWFTEDRERRFAIGAYNTAPVLGGMSALVLSNSVLMPLTGSWRWTVAFTGGVMTLALAAWTVISLRAPAPPVDGAADRHEGSGDWRPLVADPTVRVVLVLGLGAFFVAHGLGGWMPTILRDHSGFSAMASANWVAASALVGMVAALTLPRRADGRRLPIVLGGLLLVVAVGAAAIVVAPTAVDPLFVACTGLRTVVIPLVLVALMESSAVRPDNLGTAYGVWFAVAEVGGVSGPVVLGRVADSSAGFGGALLVSAAVCLALLLVVARLRRPAAEAVGSPAATPDPAPEASS